MLALHRLGLDTHVGPYRVEQFVFRHQPSGALDQIAQHGVGLGPQQDAFLIAAVPAPPQTLAPVASSRQNGRAAPLSIANSRVRSGTERREATLCPVGAELTNGRVAVVGAGGDIVEVMPSGGNHGRVVYCSKLISAPVSLADVPARTSRSLHCRPIRRIQMAIVSGHAPGASALGKSSTDPSLAAHCLIC